MPARCTEYLALICDVDSVGYCLLSLEFFFAFSLGMCMSSGGSFPMPSLPSSGERERKAGKHQ